MDTKLATKQIRIQQWSEIIHDRKASGLMVDEYCELHSLSRNQYYYWLREIKKQAMDSCAPQLVELKPPTLIELALPAQQSGQFTPEMTINIHGASVCINSATHLNLLQESWVNGVIIGIR